MGINFPLQQFIHRLASNKTWYTHKNPKGIQYTYIRIQIQSLYKLRNWFYDQKWKRLKRKLNSTEVTIERERSTCTVERVKRFSSSLLNNHNCFCNGHNELYSHSNHSYAQFNSMNHHHWLLIWIWSGFIFFELPPTFIASYFLTLTLSELDSSVHVCLWFVPNI